jgi:hypothetical protein
MTTRKPTKKYYFSVEGETEQWYLEWLKNTINGTQESACKVSFDCKVEKNPINRVKSMSTILWKTEIWHISDYESSEDTHTKQFIKTMDNMKEATKLGKQITYKFGYSNLTFDLWIVLHKIDCFVSLSYRHQYLSHLNRAYNENFKNMPQYKKENNFKRCLDQLNLSNVNDAIRRAKEIMRQRKTNKDICTSYKGFKYYETNPSLAIWEIIEKILKDCQLLNA